jgi:hypothetical protein
MRSAVPPTYASAPKRSRLPGSGGKTSEVLWHSLHDAALCRANDRFRPKGDKAVGDADQPPQASQHGTDST